MMRSARRPRRVLGDTRGWTEFDVAEALRQLSTAGMDRGVESPAAAVTPPGRTELRQSAPQYSSIGVRCPVNATAHHVGN